MREKKFKVWDNQEKKWFEPICEAYDGKLEDLLIHLSGQLGKYTLKGIVHESMFPGRYVVVQYIGLKDKDDKEMYEDDIVSCLTDWNLGVASMKGVINFNDGAYSIKGEVDGNTDGIERNFFIRNCWDLKVIGNTHEGIK